MLLRKVFHLVIFFTLLTYSLYAQQVASVSSYIETYKDVAQQHMAEFGIPASVKMAQAILESGFGNQRAGC